MSAIEDSMKAAAKAAEAAARFCRTMMRLEHPSYCKETREEQFLDDWFVTRKMGKEPTFADAIEWADKTMIDKACEVLKKHLFTQVVGRYDGEYSHVIQEVYTQVVPKFATAEDMIMVLRNEMEE